MAEKLVSQAQYAAMKGVSRKTVTVWKQKGLLVLGGDGRIDVGATDTLLLNHGNKRGGVTRQGNEPDLSAAPEETPEEAADRIVNVEGRALFSKAEAERVKENYLALLRQLEYDRESGAVAEINDVVTAVVTEYALVRNKLLNIGSRIAPRVAVLKSADEIKALIDKEVALALEELSLDGNGHGSADELRRSIQQRFEKSG
ncbi:hypothetical protein [Devosia naphthalenivorans]|uniref:hypothetical protein n=1 Tax=Devosia naphthalenivorans TaxID=2082392 RepID=UPI0013B04B15|nr:hypothetical protein [Devosia naphthalenivorans]